MATPTDDSYTRNTSGDVAGGMFLPNPNPLWRTGLSVNAWTEIAGSAMSNLTLTKTDPANPASSIVSPWCTLALDRTRDRLWSLASGGHGDYRGNQVLMLNLRSDNPVWVEVLASDDVSTLSWPNTDPYYSTGRPASCHSFYAVQAITQRNRIMRFGALGISSVGNSSPVVDGFNAATVSGNGWDAAETWASVPSGDGNGSQSSLVPVCQNASTGDVYCFQQNYGVRKWSQATNSWTKVNVGFPPIDVHGAVAYDTSRNRIFLFDGTTAGTYTFDPSTGAFTARTISFGSISVFGSNIYGLGMEYVAALDAFVLRRGDSGADVYVIDAGTFVMTKPTLTGGGGIVQTPAPPFDSGEANVYGRFAYSPSLGGCVYVPTYAANAWFLRMH